MGACCVSEPKKRSTVFKGTKVEDLKVDNKVDESVTQNKKDPTSINDREEQILNYIQMGSLNKIEEMINRGEIKVDEYIFGNTETVLHKAVIRGNDPAIIELLINKGAKVDTEEKLTKNTPLFFACVDLKVEMVEVLLGCSPNLEHQNIDGQTALEYLEGTFFPKKRGSVAKTISKEDKKKYDSIVEMIRNQRRKLKYTENVDQS